MRPKFDAGLLCPMVDGGTRGDRNAYPRADAFDTAQCEPVECAIYLGSDPELDL